MVGANRNKAGTQTGIKQRIDTPYYLNSECNRNTTGTPDNAAQRVLLALAVTPSIGNNDQLPNPSRATQRFTLH